MSGHSKWSTIRRKKGAADSKRGQIFTKLAKGIAIAAKDGPDPTTNLKLRLAIDQAKNSNMPQANIQRAIARGSGKGKEGQIEAVLYEAYGPGGVAILISGTTDNRNRAGSEVRSVLTKNGGRLAEPGAVRFQFVSKGILNFDAEDSDAAELDAIDAGAEDVDANGNNITIYTAPSELLSVSSAIESKGYKIENAEIAYIAKHTIPVNNPDQAKKLLKLIETLVELEDVTSTYSNFEMPDELINSATN